ncbi:MAG: twin-arginine translocase TatA/TatE family subunit [Bradymonadales bacterium]|nr:twin-arginine translocase TatA/TatE family subunit [Bradymonadales bacterium]
MNHLEVIAFGIGTTELLIILGIFVFIFGASRLPELGRSLGSGIRGFQKAIKGEDEKKQIEKEEAKQIGSESASSNQASSNQASSNQASESNNRPGPEGGGGSATG